MRALVIGPALAAILLLATGGRLLFIPLLFIPLGLFTMWRSRDYAAAFKIRALGTRARSGHRTPT